VSAYISTAFLCGGTVTDPQKEYNLEFLTGRTNLAKDFEALLAEHEFAPHRTRRNGVNLIYVKSSASVERILAFMGAAEASARMNAQKAVKQLRNQINRQTNCDTANLGKTARANAQTTRAIRFLQEQGALETLPEVLQQAAAMRMENPDLSLTALCACFDPPVSKSGLSHRMKKLEALAEDLRRRLEENAEKEETK
jgi:DNA-binding protein WhiA